jgi:hypothetical protein
MKPTHAQSSDAANSALGPAIAASAKIMTSPLSPPSATPVNRFRRTQRVHAESGSGACRSHKSAPQKWQGWRAAGAVHTSQNSVQPRSDIRLV